MRRYNVDPPKERFLTPEEFARIGHTLDIALAARLASWHAAAEVLEALPHVPGNRWVFPGRKKATHQTDINDSWDRIRRHAGLDDIRLHDLRHTFASRALAIGESLPMIGKLLGHTQVNTTARNVHLAWESVRASPAKVAEVIGANILAELHYGKARQRNNFPEDR